MSLYQATTRRPPSPPIIHLAGVLPSNGAMNRAKDARLRWLDGNLPRLVMPMNKCRTHGEEAKEGSNERSAFERVHGSWPKLREGSIYNIPFCGTGLDTSPRRAGLSLVRCLF